MMVESKSIMESLINFNKIIDDLLTIEEKFHDEVKPQPFLNSLSKSFKHFKDTFINLW